MDNGELVKVVVYEPIEVVYEPKPELEEEVVDDSELTPANS